tara:strand:- start:24 stop:6842 length:6819 start_codon:yes stop_codon:yes gene_type:complete
MEEDTIIIKKIYINDYIINKSLVKTSLYNLLLNTLSNKIYKTKKIHYKITNILDKIDNISKDYKNEKIFNLSYQQFNQYNIKTDYNKNTFNKKWIIPMVNEKKTLNQNNVLLHRYKNYIIDSSNLLLTYEEGELKYNSELFNDYPTQNHFHDETTTEYKKMPVCLLGNSTFEEVYVLDEKQSIYNIDNPTEVNASNSNCKVIRIPEDGTETMYIHSNNNLKRGPSSDTKIYDKEIRNTFNELRNVLKNENINIKQFLILNPLKLLHTNYNISLGNTISYLGDIIYRTNVNIDTIINNSIEQLEKTGSITDKSSNTIDYYIVDKKDFNNEYKNEKGYLFDYLKIIKNLKNYDNIYSIKILKYIYNIFGYDLNKIPYCYINYLQDILQDNINSYIDKFSSFNLNVFEAFKLYKDSKELTNDTIEYIKNLYKLPSLSYNPNDTIYNILYVNTFDKGLLYYSQLYLDLYIKNHKSVKYNEVPSIESIPENDLCKNYRIVKIYKSESEFNEDTFKLVDKHYSQENYLIEYDDFMYLLQQPLTNINQLKSPSFMINKEIKIDLATNKLDKDKYNKTDIVELTEENSNSMIEFFTQNKLYLHNLLLNKDILDEDILYNKVISFKYKSKHYVQIPYQKMSTNNIVLFLDTNKLLNFNSTTEKLTDLPTNININNIYKQIIENCKDSNLNKIEINNIKNLNNFYNDLNSTNIEKVNRKINNKQSELSNKLTFYNELLNKTQTTVKSDIYFKNIPPLHYYIYNIDNALMVNYLSKKNTNSLKKISKTELKNILDLSPFLTEYINKIKVTDQLIGDIDAKNNPKLWSSTHHYINDYEIMPLIIENGEKNNRAYYKLWELLLDDNIVKKKNFHLISLAEAPGNFVKCVQTLLHSGWNDYVICTKLDDRNTTTQNDFFEVYKNHIFGFSRGKLQLPSNPNYNGDLTSKDEIEAFINYITLENKQADLITADGGMDKKNEDDFMFEEYNHLPLFLGEVIAALFTQKIGGTFILKMYDTIYINSINLLHILSAFYNKVVIIKPYTSRPCNSEKYVKCSDFIGIPDENKDIIKKNLFNMLKDLNSSDKDKSIYFNMLDGFSNIEKNNEKIIEFNNSIVIKTRALYTEHIYDILSRKDKEEIELIKNYFGKNSNNLKVLLSSEDNDKKGYFTKKIENCIRLALSLKLSNQPLKQEYIEFYKLIRDYKSKTKNINIYPPHFSEIKTIESQENISLRTTKIVDYVKKYCIVFTKPGEHKMLDQKILFLVEHFILDKNIIDIKHNTLQNIKLHYNNLHKLYPLLKDICRLNDISKEFSLYHDNNNIISLIRNFQNNLRLILGYYLCKYTYIPLFPKYKVYENVEDQIKECGIKYNAHYICVYSGDKLDKEEFDDFMGENIHRSLNVDINLDELEDESDIKDTTTTKCLKVDTVDKKICAYILDLFKIDNNNKIDIISLLEHFKYTELNEIIEEVNTNYNKYLTKIYEQFDTLSFRYDSKNKIKKNKAGQELQFYKMFKDKKKKVNYFYITDSDIDANLLIYDKMKLTYQQKLFPNSKELNISIDTPMDKTHPLISHLLEIFLLKQVYEDYINIILYSLIQVSRLNNVSFENIYKQFLAKEDKIIKYIYNDIDYPYEKFIEQLTNKYKANILLPEDFNENTTIDDIKKLNIPEVNELLEFHINTEKNNWKNTNKEGLSKLKNSKKVIDFLTNIQMKDKNELLLQLVIFFNTKKIKKENLFKKDIGLNLKNYIDVDIFKQLFELGFDKIKMNHIFNSVNNINNTILHNREQLSSTSILAYEKERYVLQPDYDSTIFDKLELIDKTIFNNFKFLFLYVYEDEEQPYYGYKRLYQYDDRTNLYKCKFTNKTKNTILNEISQLSNEQISEIYQKILTKNKFIQNNTDFVNVNTYQKPRFSETSSMINNMLYNLNTINIDIFYKYLTLFYISKESTLDDDSKYILKNILMRFYNDPTDNIITTMNNFKTDFMSFIKSTSQKPKMLEFVAQLELLENTYDKTIHGLINTLNNDNIRTISTNLNQPIDTYKTRLMNEYNINEIQDTLSIHDLICIFNDIKKTLSYFTNLSFYKNSLDRNDIFNNLKSKFNNTIKKFYDKTEYERLIKLIQTNFFDYDLSEYDIHQMQIIFLDIFDNFNFNLHNIFCEDKFKVVFKKTVLFKLINSITISLDKLNSESSEFIVSDKLKNKFYLHTTETNACNLEKSKLENITLEQDRITNIDKKYKNLFQSIVNNSIKKITNYNNLLYEISDISLDDDGKDAADYEQGEHFNEDLAQAEDE